MSLDFRLFYRAPPRRLPNAHSGEAFLFRVGEPRLVTAEDLHPLMRQAGLEAYTHCVELCVEGDYLAGFEKMVNEVTEVLAQDDAVLFDLQTGAISTKDT